MKRARIFALCAIALPALTAPARAASASPVDPAVLEAIRRVKPADYPSANTLLVLDEQSVAYQADGSFRNTTHIVRLVLTAPGKNQAALASLDYAKDAERMEVLTAQVIKASGTVVPVAAASIKETEQSGEANIYDPNGRSIRVTFDGLAVGDAVDLTYRLTRATPSRPGFFADEFAFQTGEPILAASYSVDGPASLPLATHLYHPERAPVDATRTAAGARIRHRWSARNVPQLVPEMLMDFSVEVPMLVVTTDPSWPHFATWWASVSAPQMEATDAIREKVAELTRTAKTDAEKTRVLFDFVAANIRYRGMGVGPRSGYTPHRAADTLASRWGVCRDVAILLAAMLRAAGLQAHPALTNVGEPVLPEIAYDAFNHAIVAMPQPGGGWTYLDPTAKNSTDLLPGQEREQNVLPCTAKGEPLGVIPPGDPSANLGHVLARSTVDADGALSSSVSIDSRGMFDLLLRSMAATMPAAQQRDLAEQMIHAALPAAELRSFEISSALALWKPMKVKMEVKVPGAAVQTGAYRLLRTLVTSGALGLVENVLPSLLGALPVRKYTLDAQMTFVYDVEETVVLPAGTQVLAVPNRAGAANRASELGASCKQDGAAAITCRRTFTLRSRFVDPDRYAELRAALAALGQIARQPIILGKARSR